MIGNRFVISILGSPLHGLLSGSTLLITVTGRRTGRQISLPVNYFQESDTLWVVTSRDRTWWRNLRDGAPVALRLRGAEAKGFAEAIVSPETVAAQLDEYIRHFPISARSLGVRIADGRAEAEDLKQAARSRLVVRIRIC